MKTKTYVIHSNTGQQTGLISLLPTYTTHPTVKGEVWMVMHWSAHSGVSIEGLLSHEDASHRFASHVAHYDPQLGARLAAEVEAQYPTIIWPTPEQEASVFK